MAVMRRGQRYPAHPVERRFSLNKRRIKRASAKDSYDLYIVDEEAARVTFRYLFREQIKGDREFFLASFHRKGAPVMEPLFLGEVPERLFRSCDCRNPLPTRTAREIGRAFANASSILKQ